MVCTPQLVMADIQPRSHASPIGSTFPESSYRTALPMQSSPFSQGKSHGSRSHRLSSSSYSSADLRSLPPATTTHPATAPHAKLLRASFMGGRCSQCASPSTASASHDDMGTSSLLQPPRTAKRPSLITHPQQSKRPALIAGSSLQLHGTSGAPCVGGPHTSADERTAVATSKPPAQTMRPSGSRPAAR
jgi:hypothetical protein